MKRKVLLMDLFFIFLLGLLMSFSGKETSILFIGNSYTYRNDMPSILQEIAKSKGRNVYVEHCTQGKATLVIQSKRDEVFVAINSRKWDYIIIQGSSRDLIRDTSIINRKTIPALKRILSAIDQSNPKAKKLFYMTWGYRNGFKPYDDINSYGEMTNKVKNGYLGLKEKFGIGVVPVGMAWYNVRHKHEDIVLYVKDGAHPSLKGSYLTACCFYSGIFGDEAIGSKYFSKLGPKTCKILQRTATSTVLGQQKRYGIN